MKKILTVTISITVATIVLAAGVISAFSPSVLAQTENTELFRIGERLTYNISFGRFENVAFAETHVVSRGKLAGKNVIELQTRFRTLNFVVMEFMLVDNLRTTLASPSDGTPLFIKDIDTSNGAPIETLTNFVEKGDGIYDLSTIIYKIRASQGSGAFEILENDKRYGVTFSTIGSENISTTAGDFPTTIIDVQSDFLTGKGISSLKINITTEPSKVPVLFRAATTKGDFRATIASIQVAPESSPTPSPTPVIQPTQVPKPTPKPTATPYIDNEPLVGMPFELGEVLEYRVSNAGRAVGAVTLSAKDRKLIDGRDSLSLRAEVTQAVANDVFRVGNGIWSNVDPGTLAPFDVTIRFDGPLSGFNQTARLDWTTGKVSEGTNSAVDVPIGTHSILSLMYAIRQFNLHQSKDPNNPVNDTRVAVLWQGKPSVFVLRPTQVQSITIGQQKLPAQKVAVNTGVPQLDALNLSIWISEDDRRTPLRFSLGTYQFDLVIPELEIIP